MNSVGEIFLIKRLMHPLNISTISQQYQQYLNIKQQATSNVKHHVVVIDDYNNILVYVYLIITLIIINWIRSLREFNNKQQHSSIDLYRQHCNVCLALSLSCHYYYYRYYHYWLAKTPNTQTLQKEVNTFENHSLLYPEWHHRNQSTEHKNS